MVVSWGPKEAENHLKLQRLDRDTQASSINNLLQAALLPTQPQEFPLTEAKAKKPYKLCVFKKKPGAVLEEVMSMKNTLPIWLACTDLKIWDRFLNLELCSGAGCR